MSNRSVNLITLLAAGFLSIAAGCETSRNEKAIRAYYDYDFTAARDALRADAAKNDEQVLLNNLRLGTAALADGDAVESERALGRSFDLLSTAGLNKDRTTAAVLLHEGVRIWKGEPFEQALAYHEVATLYAVRGDWENARAAAANALFRLTDFGADQTPTQMVQSAAEDDDYLERGYTAVDTNFALGFLMQAIGSDLSGAAGAAAQFDAVLEINPDLAPIVDALRTRDYDTVLLVEYGRGPEKIAYGRDDALAKFIQRDYAPGHLVVMVDGERAARVGPVCDVYEMSQDHRWKNLEDVRRAKSAVGTAMMIGGAVVASSSSSSRSGLVGAGLLLAGLATRAGARADTRYFEFAPRVIYLVPLRLAGAETLEISLEGAARARIVEPARPSTSAGTPRAMHVRLQGPGGRQPVWLRTRTVRHGNDETGVLPGDFPWILGGSDVSTPTRETLAAYKANGRLTDLGLRDLLDLYADEGIVIGSGGPGRNDRKNSHHHVLEGGNRLFTPVPGSMGYKRLMYDDHRRYKPKSARVRNLARAMRVQEVPAVVAAAPRAGRQQENNE